MQKFKFAVGIFLVVIAATFFVSQAQAAWRGPLGAPPPADSNVAPPLNVSGAGQEKLGGLTLGLQLFNPFAGNLADCPLGTHGVNRCSQGFFSASTVFRPIAGEPAQAVLDADGFGLKVVNGRILSFGSADPFAPDGAGFCLAAGDKPLRCLTWLDLDWLYGLGHGWGGGTTVNVHQSSNSTSTTNITNICGPGQDPIIDKCIVIPPGGGLSGAGTAGRIAKWNGPSSLTDSPLADLGGRIGIGGANSFLTQLFNVFGNVKALGLCLPALSGGDDCRTSWDGPDGISGIKKLSTDTGSGITLTPNPILSSSPNGEGKIAVNTSVVTRTIGSCNAGFVMKGVKDDGTASCVPEVTCTGPNCPPIDIVPGVDTDGGTTDYLAKFVGPKKIGNSIIKESGTTLLVGKNSNGAISTRRIDLEGSDVTESGSSNNLRVQNDAKNAEAVHVNVNGQLAKAIYGIAAGAKSVAGQFQAMGKDPSTKALTTIGPIELQGIGEGEDNKARLLASADRFGSAHWKTLEELGLGGGSKIPSPCAPNASCPADPASHDTLAPWRWVDATNNDIVNQNVRNVGIGTDQPANAKLEVIATKTAAIRGENSGLYGVVGVGNATGIVGIGTGNTGAGGNFRGGDKGQAIYAEGLVSIHATGKEPVVTAPPGTVTPPNPTIPSTVKSLTIPAEVGLIDATSVGTCGTGWTQIGRVRSFTGKTYHVCRTSKTLKSWADVPASLGMVTVNGGGLYACPSGWQTLATFDGTLPAQGFVAAKANGNVSVCRPASDSETFKPLSAFPGGTEPYFVYPTTDQWPQSNTARSCPAGLVGFFSTTPLIISQEQNAVYIAGTCYIPDGSSLLSSAVSHSSSPIASVSSVTDWWNSFGDAFSNWWIGFSGSSASAPVSAGSSGALLLDVGGKIRIADGTQKENRVLASSDDGIASWKDAKDIVSGACTIEGNTINCDGKTITVPTGGGSGPSCSISGQVITCGANSITVPTSAQTSTRVSSYNDLPTGALAGFGVNGGDGSAIAPAVRTTFGTRCESGWAVALQGNHLGAGAGTQQWTCIKQ